MVEALLLILVWLGGLMFIAGLHIGEIWFALWTLAMVLLLAAVVRQPTPSAQRQRRPPPERLVTDGDRQVPLISTISDPPTTRTTQGIAEHSPETVGQAGWEPFRVDRFPGRQAAAPERTPVSSFQAPKPADAQKPGSSSEPAIPAKESTAVASPALHSNTKVEAMLPDAPPLIPDPTSTSLSKNWEQFSKDRFPIRVTAPESAAHESRAQVPPVAPQFVRPKSPVNITQEKASILPPPPDRPLGPSGEVRQTSALSPSPAAPRLSRAPRAILKPADFLQNSGVPGFLYLARNEEHWPGLHKVGQTRNHPSGRVSQLNKEHRRLTDIGDFELLDVVPVVDAYGAEQVLFQVLDDLRPARGREFFIANRSFLSEAMQAAARFILGDDEWLNDIYQEVDCTDQPAWPAYPNRYYYSTRRQPPGWMFIARNRFHQADTYRVSASVKHPDVIIKEWNNFQRTATPQIGFYAVVYAVPVANYIKAGTMGRHALSEWKLDGQRSFFRGPLSELAATLESALQTATDRRS